MSGCGGCGNGKEAVKLIFSCSGAANTGYLADSVSRQLAKENKGKLLCMAAIGADLSAYTEQAKNADMNIVIDGCPVACGKKMFDKLGLPYNHIVLTDLGVEKGKTEITREVIDRVSAEISNKM
jgi:uncharacterized metal-binding protein